MREKIKTLFDHFLYSLKITGQISRGLFAARLLITLLITLIPFAQLMLWRSVINGVSDIITGQAAPDIARMTAYALYLLGLYTANQLLGKAQEYVQYRYNDKITVFLDRMLIDKVADMDLSFFDSGELNDKLAHSWQLLFSLEAVSWQVFSLYQYVIKLVTSFVLLASLNVWLAVLVLALAVPALNNKAKMNRLEFGYQKESSRLNRRIEYFKECFYRTDSMMDIRMFGLRDFFIGNFEALWKEWYQNKKALVGKTSRITFFSLLLLSVSEMGMFVYSIGKFVQKVIGIGDVSYYLSLLKGFRGDVDAFLSVIASIGQNFAQLNAVREFIALKPSVQQSGTVKIGRVGRIEFENVSFRYPGQERDVLTKCSFAIEENEVAALVGLNGAGKTTLVLLLLRLYEPTEGRIRINGYDIRKLDLASLRGQFGVLFQDYVRYSLSLRGNITLSDWQRSDDNQAIDDACRHSRLEDVTKDWPQGLDTELTRLFDPDGKQLSGGQWQRVALARAWFRKSSFVIFDEPSAALDPEAEHRIFEYFIRQVKGKGALLISHRLANMTLADRILVLEDGRVVEQGNHNELMARSGKYADLFTLQAKKYSA